MEKEGDIHALLKEKNVPNIPPFDCGNDIPGHRTLTADLKDRSWSCVNDEHCGRRLIKQVHYRMTLGVIGCELTLFKSSRELILAVAAAMEGQ